MYIYVSTILETLERGVPGYLVREMPHSCLRAKDFDFFKEDMWDYDFQNMFPFWLYQRKMGRRICCLVGIRTQESFNRWRAIHSDKNYRKLANYKWTRRMNYSIYNAYPIYDWKTQDIWIANGKFGWPYNHLYDLYYQAGVPLSRQRVASHSYPKRYPHCSFTKLSIPTCGGGWLDV